MRQGEASSKPLLVGLLAAAAAVLCASCGKSEPEPAAWSYEGRLMSAELVGSLRAAAASAAESDASAALPASPAASASPEAASEARAVPLSADLLED